MRLLKSTSIVSPECDHRLRLSDGRWLSYADYGDPQGRPILSFHGGLSCRLDIRFASEFCKEEGIRVISIDRPGVGDSDHHPNRQVLDWPDDVSHLALELGLSRFAVLGWSAGGPFALACAYRIPELITNVGTIGCMAPVHGRPETVRESGLRLDRVLFPLVRRSPWIAGQFLKAANRLPPWVLKRNMIREVVSKADRASDRVAQGGRSVRLLLRSAPPRPLGNCPRLRDPRRPVGIFPERHHQRGSSLAGGRGPYYSAVPGPLSGRSHPVSPTASHPEARPLPAAVLSE